MVIKSDGNVKRIINFEYFSNVMKNFMEAAVTSLVASR